MPRKKGPRKKWLTARRAPAAFQTISVPFREQPPCDAPYQLSLPFPGATVPAIRIFASRA
jgi:hypothetical protein